MSPCHVFPRHHWRGSIEAILPRNGAACFFCGFRAIIGAAPLKLATVRRRRHPQHRFRAIIGAAPLKPGGIRSWRGCAWLAFPRHCWRGSIEALLARRTAPSQRT